MNHQISQSKDIALVSLPPNTNNLPLNWRAVQLGEVAREFVSGGTPSTKEPGFWDGSIAWTTSAPISEEDVSLSHAQRFITQDGLKNSASHLVPKGNLLVGTRVGVGKAVVNLIDVAISQDLTGVVFDASQVDTEFVAYQCKTEQAQKFFHGRKRGATIKGISRFDLESLVLYLPSLSEQRTIAHVLKTVQEAREARLREIALEREGKAALMQYLFTHGVHGETGKQTEIGKIPQSWKVVKLGTLCMNASGIIQTGPFGSQLHASDYRVSGIPVVNPTHLGFNTIVEDHLPFITQADADRLSKHYLIEGDILISRRGDFSRYSYISQKYDHWLCGTGCLLVRLNNTEVDNFFLSISLGLETIQNYLKQNAVGSIMPNLNTQILFNMPLPLPSLAEQFIIAEALNAYNTKIVALEQEMVTLDELFRAMLEELMNGRLSAVPLIDESTKL